MQLDQSKQSIIDSFYEDLLASLDAGGDSPGAAMAAYTASLHRAWRGVLGLLPLARGWRVLDVGSGFGLLGVEITANLAVSVTGVDIEPRFVASAASVRDRLMEVPGFFAEGSALAFDTGDILALPYPDESFELVVVRELLQFLVEPQRATDELYRVCVPGGLACVSDVDDQFYITWPEPSPAFARLHAAVATVQHERGGDRHIGRKLTTYLRRSGFEIASTVILPEALHLHGDAAAAEHALLVRQLEDAKTRLVASGAMTEECFDEDMAAVRNEVIDERFRMNARVIALGRRL